MWIDTGLSKMRVIYKLIFLQEKHQVLKHSSVSRREITIYDYTIQLLLNTKKQENPEDMTIH